MGKGSLLAITLHGVESRGIGETTTALTARAENGRKGTEDSSKTGIAGPLASTGGGTGDVGGEGSS